MNYKKIGSLIMAAAVTVTAAFPLSAVNVQAKKKSYGTSTVQILATTDLHGQSVKFNYDSGVESEGSLAQLVSVIKEKKKNLKYGTTITVDSGDTVYGIGSESIMKGTVSGSEYMYECMKAVNYDAITLGNHDFDYGVDYIQKALKKAGMNQKVVLSNVFLARSGKNLYKSSTMVTRTVKTTTGRKAKVKIGIIGATIPSLTTLYKWQGIVRTADIVNSVREEAKALKKKGADLIVVAAHTGIGGAKHKLKADNAGYALTAIPEVDAVCCGHTHMDYPAATAKAAVYDAYAKTDEDKLMHGKALVEEKDHGASLGQIQIKLGFDANGKPYVKKRSAKVHRVTGMDKEDAKIRSINAKYDAQYRKIYDKTITKIEGSTNSYFGMIEDNPMIQLCNEAKIHYGLAAVKNLAEPYRDAPVISATEYQMGGSTSGDYIYVDGQIYQKDVLNIQSYAQQRAKVYYMTGKQLRDALDFQAAKMYQTVGQEKAATWGSETGSLVSQGYQPILGPSYQNNWRGFMVYDGVEYTIDPNRPPRYDKEGRQISNGSRITSLTCNGQPVSDQQVFVLVSRHITSEMDPINLKASRQQVLINKTDHMSEMLEDYMVHQTVNDMLHISSDSNWRVDFADRQNYVIRTTAKAAEQAKEKPWYLGEIPGTAGFTFYRAHLGTPEQKEDHSGPMVVAAPLETKATGDPVKVRVETSDVSGIECVRFASGIRREDDYVWNYATLVKDDQFEVSSNGTYTVYAKDKQGNATVSYVTVDNIDYTVAVAPSVTGKVTNKKRSIVGYASPSATVYMQGAGKFSQVKANGKGYFKFTVPSLKAGEYISLWQVDTKGRQSQVVSVEVSRSGANTPQIREINNKSTRIKGIFNDDPLCRIMAQEGKTVFIPKDSEELYRISNLYNSSYKIVKGRYTCKNGSFSLDIPVQNAGKKIKVYGVDWVGRLSALSSNTKTVKEVAPNKPQLNKVLAQEGLLRGSIPGMKRAGMDIQIITDKGKVYTGCTDAKGAFSVETGLHQTGTTYSVKASDQKDGRKRTSAVAKVEAKSYTNFLEKYSDTTEIDSITDESDEITGRITLDGAASACVIVHGKKYALPFDSEGEFSFPLPDKKAHPFAYKDKVVVIVRSASKALMGVDVLTVAEALPDRPECTPKKLTEKTKKLRVVGNRDCTAVLKSGSIFVTKKAVAKKNGKYIYKFSIPKKLRKKNRAMKIYFVNTSGESKKILLRVK
ncbi:MAG: 5'-nucleotidase C-terminal domain-containing protein [Lachnospiraceae bacterium]|nr:5'-nucleotidase C-terminal domain-containing protein [Lachnospiraceae bacterium]